MKDYHGMFARIHRMVLYAAAVLTCAVLVASCGLTTTNTGADQTTATAAQGTLTGDVVMRPNCPVQSAASPCMATPVASHDVTISATDGATTTATTDGNGHFGVVLAPGAYIVQIAACAGTTGIKQATRAARPTPSASHQRGAHAGMLPVASLDRTRHAG